MNSPSELMPIPVNTPVLDGNEKRYLSECIDTGWISSEGPFIQKFETQFAARVERKFGIAVCNGSVALDAALKALKISKGDEVILPSFTIISCAAAIVEAGAVPVVVDSDPLTWNMDVTQIEAELADAKDDEERATLTKRLTLVIDVRRGVDAIVAYSEKAVTVLTETTVAIARIETKEGRASMTYEEAITELARLANRADRFDRRNLQQ